MLKALTVTARTSCLSTFTTSLLRGIRKTSGGGAISSFKTIGIKPLYPSISNTLRPEMSKRKRAVVVKAELVRALSTAKVESFDTSEEPEHEQEEDFEPELAPTEEEDSEGFNPELDGSGNKKRKKKKAPVKKKVLKKDPGEKTGPKKKPAVSRKDKLKTEDKNGDAIIRAPQVNSDYLPLPWKGRLGYACLNTYLRTSNPPTFCSRTCRISTIEQKGSAKKGQEFVESLGLANAWDLSKMIRWNEKYGIKFLRLSSEMFPFASHEKYGYDLDFAAEALGGAGKLAMEFGHRLTTHPGQYTQLASPRKEVITASVRDLEYHSQMLRLLGLKGQANRDAVMILHMGGVFGDKQATLNRFRESYTTLLSDDVKARLVLENDDVNWTVHDLLPICKELNIPLVLDYHHHNIRRREDLREGTLDLMPFLEEIKETWTRKNITQKQHYSEPRDDAVTDHDMRKHSKRVRNLPPCDQTMDLMIEAKDKEQAVFELYRKYGIGGEGLFNEVVPHKRTDENPLEPAKKAKKKEEEEETRTKVVVPEEDLGMGGEERRVYWPEGNEDWLSPQKRVRKKKETIEEADQEMAVKEGESAAVVKKTAANGRQTTKKINEEPTEEASKVMTVVVESKGTKSRGQAKKSTVKAEEVGQVPNLKFAKPSVSRAKRQKTAAKIKPEDGKNEGYIPTVAVAAPKRIRAPLAKRVVKKPVVLAPDPNPDSEPSSPPALSGEERDNYTGDAASACAAKEHKAFHSDVSDPESNLQGLVTDTEELVTVPQKKVFQQIDAEAVATGRRRSTRARRAMAA